MSTTIDEKVVEMRFDNKQFENGVQTSMSTLEKLKQSLNLTGASKGLENVGAAAKGINLTGLSSAVETVHTKFSALQVVAVTALANITNSAVNAGKRIVSSLTIDPVKMGFSEYETQINAVQTILANTESKGKTLEDVNKALDELNTYADKTIYNFTEMTRNIGTFTAAGVDLDTSVAAIKGIANLAAVSGSTSQQASTAMYQLSQALASGTVKLMDWNSVVNAGMGGQVFQDALKETARVHGVEIDKMIESEGSFRETLQNGWLTSEILTETLSKFTGDLNEEQLKTMGYTDEQIKSIIKMGQTANDAATKVKTFTQLFDTLKEAAQSGWTQSWEIIVGDFEEAKQLLTEVSDTFGAIIGASAQARNEMLQGWKDLGGRTAFIDAVRNAFQGVLSIITPVKEAFREIFPPMTAEKLLGLTEGLKNLTARLKIGESTANKLKRTFKGVFALFDIGVQLVSAISRGFGTLLGSIAPAGDGLLSFTANLGDAIVKFRDFLKSGDVFNKVIEKIGTALGVVVNGVRNFVGKIGNAFKGFANIDLSGVEKFTDKVKLRFEPLTALGEGVKKICNFIIAMVKKVAPVAIALGNIISKVFGGLFNKISTAMQNADINTTLDLLNAGLLTGLLVGLKKFIGSMGDIKDTITGFLDNVKGIVENVNGILGGVKDAVKSFTQDLKAKTLLKIAGAIAILTASILVLSTIDSAKLTTSLGAITTLFIELFASMAIFEKLAGDKKKFGSMAKLSTGLIGISVAVLILSAAMKNVAGLEWSEITKGITAITALTAMMVASAAILGKTSGKMTKGMTGLVIMALAMKVLVGVIRDLGAMNIDELERGLSSVGRLLGQLTLFMLLTNKTKMGVSKGTGFVLLAASLNILASAVKKFAELDDGSLKRGLTAVGVILAELIVFTNLTKNAKRVISTATGLVIIASSMLIFAKAIKNIGALQWDEIGRGLVTMAGALTLVIAAMKLLPKGTMTKGTGLVLTATALVILGKALSNMGGMSWDEVGRALVTLAGSLTVITAAMLVMKRGIAGASAMLVMSAALAIFTPALRALGHMSWEEIGRGLATIAGAFTIVGVAGLLLGPIAPIILTLSAAIALLGVGCIAAGAGVLAFSAGLSALAISGTAGAAALVVIVSSLLGLIPLMLQKVGEGIVELCKIIANSTDAVCGALTSVILALINALVACIPPLVNAIGVLLDKLLEFILEYVPKIVDTGVKLIVALLKGISDNIPSVVEMAVKIITNFLNAIGKQSKNIIQAGYDLIIDFINGLADSIRKNTPRLISAVKNLFKAVKEAALLILKESMPAFLTKGKELMTKLKDGISNKISGVVDKVKSTASECIGKLKEKLSDFKTKGGEFMAKLKDGISNKISDVVEKVKSAPTKCIEGLKEKLSRFNSVGKDMMNGLIEGVKSKFYDIKRAAINVIDDAVNAVKDFLGIHSPSRVFAEIGEYSDEGLAVGLKKFAGVAAEAAKDVGKATVESLSTPLSRISDVINDNFVADPMIRPVIDLTDIQNGAAAVNGMFSNPRLSIAGTGINVEAITAHTGSLAHLISQNQAAVNDNRDVVAALDKVREDITDLGEAISKMKVVLDSGATVGSLESEIDKRMGTRTTYKGRWL